VATDELLVELVLAMNELEETLFVPLSVRLEEIVAL